ncbi:MAG: 4Fe-4S ferredoxin [Thermosphaera sp.]
MDRYPRLLDTNAKSRVIRDKKKIMIFSRCMQEEHPSVLKEFEREYCLLSVCPEAEHVNMVGFKLAGILARGEYDELAVLTVDGSMHCTQIHWMVEEVFKTCKPKCERRHLVYINGQLVGVDQDTVKKSRFLSKISRLADPNEH